VAGRFSEGTKSGLAKPVVAGEGVPIQGPAQITKAITKTKNGGEGRVGVPAKKRTPAEQRGSERKQMLNSQMGSKGMEGGHKRKRRKKKNNTSGQRALYPDRRRKSRHMIIWAIR